ncbi:MAG TPA: hypothetical protein VGN97_06000 [Mesorhizobium sp.]|nr:hypothetical protein [Mesorhizobium sp.]
MTIALSCALLLLASILAFLGATLPQDIHRYIYASRPPPSPYWDGWWDEVSPGEPRFASGFSPFDLLSGGGFHWLLLTSLYFGLAVVLGIALRRIFFPPTETRSRIEQVLLPFAGFLPAYMLVCGLNRLVSLVLPARETSVLSFLILTAAALAYVARQSTRIQSQDILWPAILLVLYAVLTLQYAFIFVTGDASIREVHTIFLSPLYGVGSGSKLPIIAYHYDEVSFLLPVVYARSDLAGPQELIFAFWILHTLSKLSAFSLTFFSLLVPRFRG